MIEIDEKWILQSLSAWNYSGKDFREVAEQLYAQMIGWTE